MGHQQSKRNLLLENRDEIVEPKIRSPKKPARVIRKDGKYKPLKDPEIKD